LTSTSATRPVPLKVSLAWVSGATVPVLLTVEVTVPRRTGKVWGGAAGA